MKANTIKLVLRQQLNKWIESIKDDHVRDLIKRDVIVSGGAINSMFMDTPINDYDVYFRTRETVLAVSHYYVNLYNNSELDIPRLGGMPKVMPATIVNINGEAEERVIIYVQSVGVAGEATEDAHAERLSEAFDEIVEVVKKGDPYRPIFFSENAITLSNKFQVVIRFYGEPEEIHNNYDFVHAMCYYDYANNNLNRPGAALEAMLSKTLTYSGSLYPLASMFRTRKFIKRGWSITAGQMLKIAQQISMIDFTDIAMLREQLIGVDQSYMSSLIHALENKPAGQKIDATYVANLIDRIFE